MTLKESLGIWALGLMITRFVLVGYPYRGAIPSTR